MQNLKGFFNAIPMPTPNDFFMSTCKTDEEVGGLFELPKVSGDYREIRRSASTWRQQISHAQMLIAWRKAQRLPPNHSPRNSERFYL